MPTQMVRDGGLGEMKMKLRAVALKLKMPKQVSATELGRQQTLIVGANESQSKVKIKN